jgi:hypothetical protein
VVVSTRDGHRFWFFGLGAFGASAMQSSPSPSSIPCLIATPPPTSSEAINDSAYAAGSILP